MKFDRSRQTNDYISRVNVIHYDTVQTSVLYTSKFRLRHSVGQKWNIPRDLIFKFSGSTPYHHRLEPLFEEPLIETALFTFDDVPRMTLIIYVL